jgi:hypothetical protein
LLLQSFRPTLPVGLELPLSHHEPQRAKHDRNQNDDESEERTDLFPHDGFLPAMTSDVSLL